MNVDIAIIVILLNCNLTYLYELNNDETQSKSLRFLIFKSQVSTKFIYFIKFWKPVLFMNEIQNHIV